jgi:YtxH-like protein
VSERGEGFGSFLLGLGLGAVLGFLFAPEPGEATRGKLQRKLRGLRDLAADKAGELGQLLEPDAADEEKEEEEEGPSRAVLERRLTAAKRRRRAGKDPARLAPAEEDDPVA